MRNILTNFLNELYIYIYIWVYQCIPLVSFLIILNVCASYIETWNFMLQSLRTALVVEIHAKIYGGLCPFYVLGVGYTNFMNLFVSPLYFWLTFLLHWNLHVLPHNILFFTHVCFLLFLNEIIYFYFIFKWRSIKRN